MQDVPIGDAWVSRILRDRTLLVNVGAQELYVCLATTKWGAVVSPVQVLCAPADDRGTVFRVMDELAFVHITVASLLQQALFQSGVEQCLAQ